MNPVEKRNEIETMIKNELKENNIKEFLESNLKLETKIRILSKMQKMILNNNDNLSIMIKDYIFNIQNNNNNNNKIKDEEEKRRELFMIIYSKEEIYKEREERKFELINENLMIPNIKELNFKNLLKITNQQLES